MTPTCYRCRSPVTPQGTCACPDGVCVICGDNREVLPHLSGVTAVVTDPPYGLRFMGKGWDHGVPGLDFWKLILGACKPGTPLLAFGGTRTFHRLACAIEDAGFEIRDCLMWLYGSGFPKSLDISKKIDAAAGVVGEPGPMKFGGERLARLENGKRDGEGRWGDESGRDPYTYLPATDAARLWSGWGTSLKPAWEPVVLGMAPLDGTFANNALTHGVAGLAIDKCRVGTETRNYKGSGAQPHKLNAHSKGDTGIGYMDGSGKELEFTASGRWPANLILSHTPECVLRGTKEVGKGERHKATAGIAKPFNDGKGWNQHSMTRDGATAPDNYGTELVEAWECSEDCPVGMLDEQSGESGEQPRVLNRHGSRQMEGWGMAAESKGIVHGDTGGASRFFYTAKASRDEREQGLRGQIPCVQCGDKDTKHHVTHGQQIHHLRAAGRDGIPSIADIRRMWTTYKRNGHKGTPPEWNLADCIRNNHPTVKPLDLMSYLCKLVSMPKHTGTLLDPFCGSGSTLLAATRWFEHVIGIDADEESCRIACERLGQGVLL